ncbi:MAG TPA: hypothetical protein VFV33_06065 [Gemmatimonadaceae bacterium]|nr:hypothetical protein [Gemmatimonadaceae bacterium]
MTPDIVGTSVGYAVNPRGQVILDVGASLQRWTNGQTETIPSSIHAYWGSLLPNGTVIGRYGLWDGTMTVDLPKPAPRVCRAGRANSMRVIPGWCGGSVSPVPVRWVRE